MSTIFFTVVATLVAALICSEVRAWAPHFVRRLIRIAVSLSPQALRERLHEEWAAHVAEVPGHFGKLIAAGGSCREKYWMASVP